MLWKIPKSRRKRRVEWYIKAFTIDTEERQMLYLNCKSDTTTIDEFATYIPTNNDNFIILMKKFLKWCTFDLSEEIQQLFNNLYSNERAQIVMKLRAKGQTLEQIGDLLGITRERVRQIEMKTKRTFTKLHSRVRIVSKIAAERNGDTILSPTEISIFCEKYSMELLYLLQSYEGTNYIYDKQLNIFILGDDSLHDRVDAYLERLPNIVAVEQLKEFIAVAEEDENIPGEMFEKAFFESYSKTGSVYHRSRLSLANIYRDILNKFFRMECMFTSLWILRNFGSMLCQIMEIYGFLKIIVPLQHVLQMWESYADVEYIELRKNSICQKRY